MPATSTRGLTNEAFEAFLAERREPQWLLEARRAAWQTFTELPLPSRHEEEWMRTDIRLFRLESFGLPADVPPAGEPASALLTAGVDLAGRVAVQNSHPQVAELAEKYRSAGVLFGSLDELIVAHGDLLRPWLYKAVEPGLDKFAALQAACWSGGTVLYVPRGVRVDEPLHALAGLSGGVDLDRTLVILEEGAHATLMAETAGDDQPALHCGATEVFIGRGANLRYVSLQNWGAGTWHFAHQKALVGREGYLQWTIGALGARLAKVNQHVALVDEDARAEVNGVMFTEGRQHLSYHTKQLHEAPHCKSDLLYKGALQDNSRIVWRGMIRVEKGAQKTDAYQRDDNLVLSQHARADSIPGLEIEADDVRCTHGATVGRVDDEQIFYARCRGLTRNEAVRMIVTGFFQQVFDRIAVESVRESLGRAIVRKIREYE